MNNNSTVLGDKNLVELKKTTSSFFVLLALAISAFSIGTTEFVMAGVLPNIAQSFSISIPTVGWLMTGYALGVVFSAPILTAFTIHIPRKYVLIALMGLFIIGNVIAATASSYALLMAGRIIAALCHGTFFGIGSVVAANVIGVPMGTMLAQHFGWRSMFWVIAGLGSIGMLGIIFLVPYQSPIMRTKLSCELAMFKRIHVWLSLFVTALGFGGVFAAFAYIAPMMTNVAGFAPSSIIWLLLLFGLGLVLGNIVGGRAADHALPKTLCFLLIFLAIVLFTFIFTAHYKVMVIINLFLLDFFAFAIVSPVQMQVLQAANDAPTLASAVNIAAFNVGIDAGTYLGGLTIHLGFADTSVNWVGGCLVIVGLIIQLIIVILKN